jgi:hypothetical protein
MLDTETREKSELNTIALQLKTLVFNASMIVKRYIIPKKTIGKKGRASIE